MGTFSEARSRKPLLDPDQPAHPAMLLLAESDGNPKPELQDVWPSSVLDLDPGWLLPVWGPTEADDGLPEPLTHEDRMVTFREELATSLRISMHGPDIIKSSRPFLSVTPVEEVPSPKVVLDCVRQWHSLFAPNWY
jgi:hypothetical protein